MEPTVKTGVTEHKCYKPAKFIFVHEMDLIKRYRTLNFDQLLKFLRQVIEYNKCRSTLLNNPFYFGAYSRVEFIVK